MILGIETSTPVSSVALGGPDGAIAHIVVARGRGHVEFLVPAIRTLLDLSRTSFEDLTGVAVGVGPGLFTSMRVGIATAKTIAQTLEVPVVGVSSLEVLAFGVRETPKLICACIDARRGEVFAAAYRSASAGVMRLDDPRTWDPRELAQDLAAREEQVLLVGDGASAYAEELVASRAEIASAARAFPSAAALVECAIPRFARGEGVSPGVVEPMYVRKSDAEIKWAERGVAFERPLRVKIPKRALEGNR